MLTGVSEALFLCVSSSAYVLNQITGALDDFKFVIRRGAVMRVRGRKIDIAMVPPEILPHLGRDLGQHFVTPGLEYEVHALVASDGVVLAQIVNDVKWPDWTPVWAFDVIDQVLPDDWMCSVFKNGSCLVLGPAFIAASAEDYDAMVDLEADKQALFWRRINST